MAASTGCRSSRAWRRVLGSARRSALFVWYENNPRQAVSVVLGPAIPLLDEGPGCKDRSFSGGVGGAATEPRSGAGTAFLRRAPLGSNRGAGCCMARVLASGASTGQDGKR